MKRLPSIAAIAVTSLLLVGCESQLDWNTHFCGLYAARTISLKELDSKLGITQRFDPNKDGDRSSRYCRAVLGVGPDEEF